MVDSDGNISRPRGPLTPGDSTCVTRSVHTSTFQGASLREKRHALLEDLGYHIPEIPIKEFLDTFLPPLKRSLRVSRILASLKRAEHIKNGRWESFPKNPSELGKKEHEAFQGLESIFDKVVELATKEKGGLEQTLRLRLLPNAIPQLEKSGKIRPNAVFILKETSGHAKDTEHEWCNLAGTCGFKVKGNENTRDAV